MKAKAPKICLIAAVAENLAIGKDNKLLWHIGEDLKRFKKITAGHPVIMGEKTFYSIGKPLPDRLNIVLSQDKSCKIDGCKVCHSISEAVKLASKENCGEIFFIGGGSVYAQALPIADRLYLTIVSGKFGADTFFPEYKKTFREVSSTSSKDKNHKYRFTVWEKK